MQDEPSQPLPEIHLRSSLDYEIEPNGNITYIKILSVIAIFMLIIATINFMNLSTAIAGKRAREIGMKKVVGATRRQLAVQFITESVVVSILGLLIASGTRHPGGKIKTRPLQYR